MLDRHAWGQDAGGHRPDSEHLQIASLTGTRIMNRLFGSRDGEENISRRREKGPTRRSGQSTLRRAVEQRDLQICFQALDLLRKGRLSDEQTFGSLGERPQFTDRHKVLKLPQIHNCARY